MAAQKTQTFPKLIQIQKELTPFKQFWDITHKYAQKRGPWWVTKLATVNVQNMVESVNAWFKTLNSIKNFSPLQNFPKIKALMEFIFLEIEQMKMIMPLIQRLRAKGLEKRHYVEMSRLIKQQIDPVHISMKDVQTRGLANPETLEAIKQVSGIAFKENSIKLAIDQIEREIKELSFETMAYKETSIRIIRSSDHVVQLFEELLIKLQAVKGNEFAKFQMERINRFETQIQDLQVMFENWIRVQKSWIYLEPIYS
jgi:dynein heavy chain